LSKDVAQEILKYLDFDNGYYVECGSNDGLFQNNSLALELNQGWTGMLIEASPQAYSQCLKNRDNTKNTFVYGAIVPDTYGKPTITGDFNGHPMGSIGGRRLNNAGNAVLEVPAYTLTQIFEKYNVSKIDFFALDIEGFELAALQGMDFDRWSPTYFLIEWNVGEDELFPFMESKGYENLGCLSNFNYEEDPGWLGQHNDFLFKLKDNK
jgi:FkbM family methyltransferase